MENETDNLESLNQEEEVEPEITEVAEPETASELKRAQELAQNQKIRAEKAEKEKKEKEGETKEVKPELSTKDVLYLAKTDIHEDDLSEVLDWAKFKNISVQEAYKSLKGTLDVRNAERKTAEATDTKGGRPAAKITGDSLLEKARQGQVSEKEEDIDKIVEARMEEKINRK